MLPEFLKHNFWSYKFEDIDKNKHKKLIMFQILNHGCFGDWQWLFKNYPTEEIRKFVSESLATAWFRISLSLWESVLNTKAQPTRFPDLPIPPRMWV